MDMDTVWNQPGAPQVNRDTALPLGRSLSRHGHGIEKTLWPEFAQPPARGWAWKPVRGRSSSAQPLPFPYSTLGSSGTIAAQQTRFYCALPEGADRTPKSLELTPKLQIGRTSCRERE